MSVWKRHKRRILVAGAAVAVYCLLFLAILAFGEIDYSRLVAGKEPIFAVFGHSWMTDGGTETWEGMGYFVCRMSRLGFDSAGREGLTTGPILEYTWRGFWPGAGALMRDKGYLRFGTYDDLFGPPVRGPAQATDAGDPGTDGGFGASDPTEEHDSGSGGQGEGPDVDGTARGHARE